MAYKPKSKDYRALSKASTFSKEMTMKAKGSLLAPKEVLDQIAVLAPEAVETLQDLMRNSSADSVKLKAALEILGLSGISKDNTLTIKTETKDLSDEEVNDKLQSLLDRAKKDAIGHVAKEILDDAEEAEFTDITEKEED